MAKNIQINRQNVEGEAMQIESAASYLTKVPLDSQDTRSTIPANINSRAAYERSQVRLFSLGNLLDQEVENIRGLNAAFAQFDEMMGHLAENERRGIRTAVGGVSYTEK